MALFTSLRGQLAADSLITSLALEDIRFPTSSGQHGSDAVHKDPDYSCAYVVISANGVHHQGHGLTFTLGRGTEVVVAAIRALEPLLVGQSLLKVQTATIDYAKDDLASYCVFLRLLLFSTDLHRLWQVLA